MAGASDLTPRLAGAEQTNTSIFFGDKLFLKVFRAVEEGPNADASFRALLRGCSVRNPGRSRA